MYCLALYVILSSSKLSHWYSGLVKSSHCAIVAWRRLSTQTVLVFSPSRSTRLLFQIVDSVHSLQVITLRFIQHWMLYNAIHLEITSLKMKLLVQKKFSVPLLHLDYPKLFLLHVLLSKVIVKFKDIDFK